MLKVCRDCQVAKPLSEFGRHKANKDGLNSRCRDCWKAYCKPRGKAYRESAKGKARAQEYAPKRQERLKQGFESYCCPCGATDPESFYTYNRTKCKACIKSQVNHWRQTNREAYNTYQREYYNRR